MYEVEIKTMQHNLVHIRKSLNMSAREFGGMIGVTRQTINNIEAGRNRLSQTQYLAILYVLENQIIPGLTLKHEACIRKLLSEKVTDRNYFDSLSF